MSENDEYVTDRHSTPNTAGPHALATARASLERYWAAFKYSSLYITLSAVVEVGIAMALLGVSLNPAPLVVGLVTFAVYTNDRIADAETDAFSDPDKAAFVTNYEHLLRPMADGAYGLAVMIAVTGGPQTLVLALLPGAFWLCYASGWFDSLGPSIRRLKSLLILNTAVVALAWAVVLTFLPIAFADGHGTAGSLFVFAYFFCRVFTFVELSNIPDVVGDRRIGVSTIPVVFGIDGTRYALYLVNALTVAVVAAALARAVVPLPAAVPLLAGTAYSLGITALVGRWENVSALIQAAEAEYVLTYLTLLAVFVLG